MVKKPKHGDINNRRFVLNCNGHTQVINVPCEWDEEIGEWMMTPEALRLAEQAKLRMPATQRHCWVSRGFLRLCGQKILELARR